MNALFATISSQFSKSLLLGSLLPVLLTLALWLLLVHPLFPDILSVPAALSSLDPVWQFTWITILAIVAAAVLAGSNRSILRLYQGYPWEDSPPGFLMKAYHRWRYRQIRDYRDRLWLIWNTLQPGDLSPKAEAKLTSSLNSLALVLDSDYPYEESLVLPTRFGNVNRNAEHYSQQRYGISAVMLWPRLVSVVEPGYATILEELKTAMDFAVHLAFLTAAISLATVCLTIQRSAVLGAKGFVVGAVLMLVSLFSYLSAVDRARQWCTYLKSAIDLYRKPLLDKLGYKYSFVSVDSEKEVWEKLAQQWTFAETDVDLPFSPLPVIALPATSVAGGEKIEIARGVGPISNDTYPTMNVTVSLRNAAPEACGPLFLSDLLPPNWIYVW
ncbi:MAG TPA: hypothetical protein VEX68_16125, partial [Bryobacteraceae bacterium]|nr:hypothetical protein [Bryobacteraceae bacterium]